MKIMDNLDYIDGHFKNERIPEQEQEFEKRMAEDPGFAEDVAFYISAHNIVQKEWRTERKKTFREIYDRDRDKIKAPVRPLWTYLAAAATVAALIVGLYLFFKPGTGGRELADQYIQEQLKTLGITMSSREDALQTGLRLYNEAKFSEALQQFESIVKADTSYFTAKKYTGFVYLRLGQYDKAITVFTQLQQYTSLYANPATFYLALTLMERNSAGDTTQAKKLLQQVVQDDLEGKEIAQQWLGKL
jgi:tetratricopeptide (TPR) repeat protein